MNAPSATPPVPFRLIAIVHDPGALAGAWRWCRLVPGLGVAVMVRDPLHRAAATIDLARRASGMDWPANVTLITNTIRFPGIPWWHRTSAQSAPQASGPGVLMPHGASVHSVDEARSAERSGAAYVIASPVFPTPSKPGHPGIGLEALTEIVGAVALPAFALGGIAPSNVRALLEAGAHGVASVSLFDPVAEDDLFRIAEELSAPQRTVP